MTPEKLSMAAYDAMIDEGEIASSWTEEDSLKLTAHLIIADGATLPLHSRRDSELLNEIIRMASAREVTAVELWHRTGISVDTITSRARRLGLKLHDGKVGTVTLLECQRILSVKRGQVRQRRPKINPDHPESTWRAR